MELKEFITATLTEIAEGVYDSQKHYKQLGGAVNPSNISPLNGTFYKAVKLNGNNVDDLAFQLSSVEFEIGLVEGDVSEGKSGIGVFLPHIGLGTNSTHKENNSTVTKVRFCIPVKLPAQQL